MIYPTLLAALLIAAGAPIALAVSALSPGNWAVGMAWSATLLVLTLLDGLVAGRLGQLSVDAPRSSELGETVKVELSAVFQGLLLPRRAEARAAIGGELVSSGRADGALALDETKALSGTLDFLPERRGTVALDTLWLRWRGPMGLAWRQVKRDDPSRIAILPNVGAIRSPGLQVFLKDAIFGQMRRRLRGEGSEFEALSDYQSGMDRRSIDWKVSARHSKLMAKEYEIERNNQIILALDSGAGMCEPVAGLPRIDRAVSAALLTAYVALKTGDKVRLFSFAARPQVSTGFLTGGRAFARLQQEAAAIEYSFQESNYTLALSTLAQQLQRRSLIIVFTDFTDPISAELMLESVARLIDRHLVLFVVQEDEELLSLIDRAPENADMVAESVTANNLLEQRRLVITRLRHMGVDVVEGRHDVIGARLVNAYLAIKRRGAL